MKPGPELDRLMAEKVMGWVAVPHLAFPGEKCWESKSGARLHDVREWSPSTRIDHAFEVVEKVDLLVKRNLTFDNATRKWVIWAPFTDQVSGDTAPHAICLAAYEAVGGDK